MTDTPDPTSSQPASEPASDTPENPPGTSTLPEDEDDGVGWLPAIVATCLLIAAAMFVCCGVTTYSLFQNGQNWRRGPCRAHDPYDRTKPIGSRRQTSVDQNPLGSRFRRRTRATGKLAGKWGHEPIDSDPHLGMGDLAAIEAMIQSRDDFDEVAKAEASKQISRLRKAILSDQLTIFAINDVLTPILQDDDSLRGQHLTPNPSSEVLMEIVTRSRLTADNNNIEDAPAEAGSIVEWVQQEVAAGRTEGSR